VLTCSPDLG